MLFKRRLKCVQNQLFPQCLITGLKRIEDFLPPTNSVAGDVAQMVERSLSMREVLGSTPSFSINTDSACRITFAIDQNQCELRDSNLLRYEPTETCHKGEITK
ncbi:hypothetical protein VTP01DRAFT_9842 [Rhizomucor pusillus]|uniref:uncharacterized protein n=1 Tax=Rhizomucor pusillus TaxID=4840 RepID=UPI003742E186